jgi:pilus assembly protein CpaF
MAPPTTSRDYRAVKETIHHKLRERLDVGRLAQLSREAVRYQLKQIVENMGTWERTPLTLQERERLYVEVLDEVFGLGPLEPLLKDNTISDILVNSYNEVYVERNGRLEKTSVQFRDDAHLIAVITRIVSAVGRRVDETSPIVDARLADGSRANAIIPPLSLDGPCLSIRRFGKHLLDADDLVRNNTLTQPMLDFLRACVFARLNIVVSGGPGSGKTTLLNVLSSFISKRERIVTIEDATELQFRQDHVVRLETRPPNIEGSGAIPARRLVINALRMRPDRIVVGEVRGEEALDMLQAMNTGHDGSLTTIHARAGYDAISRLETMVTAGGLDIPLPVIRAQIASAVNLIIQVSRLPDGTRKVVNISEITGMQKDGTVDLQEIFLFNKTGIGEDDAILGEFSSTGKRPQCLERLAGAGASLPMSLFDPKSIQIHNAAIERLRDASDLAAREELAAAMSHKATSLAELSRLDGEVAAYDALIEKFAAAEEPSLRVYVANALLRKGLVLEKLNRPDEAIQSYDLLATRFNDAAEIALQNLVATALVHKGAMLSRVNRHDEAIQAYDSVVKKFGEIVELSLQEQVATALVSKGIALGRLNRREEAIRAYDLMVKRFGESPAVPLQEQVARAQVSKGVALSRLNRNDDAVRAYELVISKFAESGDLVMQEYVARALVSKGVALGHVNRREEALQAYDCLLHKFNESIEPTLQEEVARALAGKAAVLSDVGRSEEEIVEYNSVIEQLERMNRSQMGGSLGVNFNGNSNGHKKPYFK